MTDAARSALAYFVQLGWTPAQAAGIVANLVAESNLNPAAVGDGGQAYGVAQWHPDRQAHFAGLIGNDIHGSTLDEQLAFVHAELLDWEKSAGDALRACTTAAEAGACVSRMYERPADREGEASRRAALAEKVLSEYGGTPAAAAQSSPQTVAADSRASAATPIPTTGVPMGTLLIPLLTSVVGSFLNPTVAQNAMSVINKDGGQGTAAQNLLTTLLGAVAGAAGVTPAAMKADEKVAIAAVSAVQSDSAKLKAVEDAAAAHLTAVMPFIQQLALLDQMRYDAEAKGKQTVSTIAIEEHKAGLWDMTQWIVVSLLVMLWGIAWGLLAAIIGLMFKEKPDPTLLAALIGLAGPIWTGAIVASVVAIVAYRFDGSKESHAANEAQRATERFREETGKA